jgi:hypothetical protein
VLLAAALAPAQELARPGAAVFGSPGSSSTILYLSKSPDPRSPLPAEMLYMSKPPGPVGRGVVLQRTALAEPPPAMGAGQDETEGFQIQLEPPGPDRLFRVESEANFYERIRQETRGRQSADRIVERVEFPVEPVLATGSFPGRTFPPLQEVVEPNYLCYGRLYFEEKNSERYGWDLGIIQPLVSAGAFYCDLLWLPYHMGTEPCRKYECNAGYCLPGDPVPYLIYPPEFSVTGLAAETAVVAGLLYIFP